MNCKKLKNCYNSYKKSASLRGYFFDLSENQFFHVVNSNCGYCGDKPRMYSDGLVRNGIDRVDNNVGYVHQNIIACCSTCNSMKGTLSYSEFRDKCNKISNKTEEFTEVLKNGINSSEVLAYTLKQGRYLSPNEIFKCIIEGTLKKSDIKYSFKKALEDFSGEFKITKNLFKKKGFKLNNVSLEDFNKSQLKIWNTSETPEEFKMAEKIQIQELNIIKSLKKVKKSNKVNSEDFIKDHGLSKSDIMELPPF